MALVVPAAFTLITRGFGALNEIAGILLSSRKFYNGHKKLRRLLDGAEPSLNSIRDLVKEVDS